jgi:hypothetical protein
MFFFITNFSCKLAHIAYILLYTKLYKMVVVVDATSTIAIANKVLPSLEPSML